VSTYWDIMGSMFVGSLLMLTLLLFNNNLSNERIISNLWTITQKNATTLSDVIEYDLKKIGYNVTMKENSIIYADSNEISFLSDIDNNGNVDSIRYYVNNASGTSNPNDKLFYRIVNGLQTSGSALGLTYFKINYYDSTGAVTNILNKIKEIEVTFEVENTINKDNNYSKVFIKKKVKPKNII